MTLSSSQKISGDQVLQRAYKNNSIRVQAYSPIVGSDWDELDIGYRSTAPAIGEIGMLVYKKAGVTVATLQLTYTPDGKLSNVARV